MNESAVIWSTFENRLGAVEQRKPLDGPRVREISPVGKESVRLID